MHRGGRSHRSSEADAEESSSLSGDNGSRRRLKLSPECAGESRAQLGKLDRTLRDRRWSTGTHLDCYWSSCRKSLSFAHSVEDVCRRPAAAVSKERRGTPLATSRAAATEA